MAEANTQDTVYVARQPILDGDMRTQAYELLFRSGLEGCCRAVDGNSATRDVIANTFLEIGLDELTANKPAFINFTRQLLLEKVPQLLPPEIITVEILEDVSPDAEVLAACGELKDAGYTLALDDFVMADGRRPLLALADIVKVDFFGVAPEQRGPIARQLIDQGVDVLAEKVETREEFEQAKEDGYDRFQGYFFSKPVIRQGKTLSTNSVTHLRLLHQINQPDLSLDDLESTIKTDVAMAYRLVKFVNSAWFGLRNQVESIRHALVLLGPKEIRKWFALVSIRTLAQDKPGETVVQAITRARMGELVAQAADMAGSASDLFLMGLFSVLDCLLDTRLEDVLAKLPVEPQIKSALLGESCLYRTVLELVLSHERGDWQGSARHAANLGLPEDQAQSRYTEAVKWATQAASMAA